MAYAWSVQAIKSEQKEMSFCNLQYKQRKQS